MVTRPRIIKAIAATVVAAAGFGAIAALSAGSTPLSNSEIMSIATTAAARAGDPTPTAIQSSALTTRNQANIVASGDGISSASGGDANSYLVVGQGTFTLTNAEVLPGTPAPTGSVLELVVDASTGHITDVGLQNVMPDVAKLGPVTNLR